MIATQPLQRQRLQVQGVVQGVGFRPYVYGLATCLGLTGFVGNDSSGVFIEIEGPPDQLRAFQAALQSSLPPLAHLEQVTAVLIPVCGDQAFAIVASQTQATASTLISPDLTVCDDCLRELFDPQDRRYGYPLINCTNCGPRFTITEAIPYDRPLTTMRAFTMCAHCQAEYDDPSNRRFHAQPNACPVCGPQLWLQWPDQCAHAPSSNGQAPTGQSALLAAQTVLANGGIVAVKGVGGFHLACDATNEQAVMTLRQRKGRVDKPFAVMVADLDAAYKIVHINAHEAALLQSRERPIVLLKKRADGPLSPQVAPGNDTIGIMLPYTPLHHLLFAAPLPRQQPAATRHSPPATYLVMTSGNFSNEPIVIDNDEAQVRLAGLADAFLLHNRAIYVPCDDSVVRVCQGQELPVRRSRGYAPFPIKLPFALPPTLAVGGELKSTFCLVREQHALMSQHIGDMEKLETLQAFDHAVDHFQRIFRVTPERIAYDLHPGYLSRRWAEEHRAGHPLIGVQHHHAHIAAVMAEHGLAQDEQVIGLAFDGTGYGHDGAIWGGELFAGGYANFRRVAHLAYVPLPGGDAAVKKPYRMALAHLWAASVAWTEDLPPVAAAAPTESAIIQQQLARRLNVVATSSIGRLFDAVAALAGVRQEITYEAQAAIELEVLADREQSGSYAFGLPAADAELATPYQFSAAPVIRAVAADVQQGVSAGAIAMKFHRAVAQLILQLAQKARSATGLTRVALSGGVFQNVLLLELAGTLLEADNFTVLTHRLVPPNDGGLALGQAVVAGVRLLEEERP
ncbi:MAG: carbamoyltransferase HypF [Caldilineaceae bacterium]